MIVRKYGGSSLCNLAQFESIANCLPKEGCVLVLSAPYGLTDTLTRLSEGLDDDQRNQLLSTGEMKSVATMQRILEKKGISHQALNYQEIGLTASSLFGGEIISQEVSFIQSLLKKKQVVIVPGFVATYKGKLAILKRGGSDDTAIALSIALNASLEIFSDVDAIYDQGRPLANISYDRLMDIIQNERPMSFSSIKMAKAHQLRILFQHWQGSLGTIIA